MLIKVRVTVRQTTLASESCVTLATSDRFLPAGRDMALYCSVIYLFALSMRIHSHTHIDLLFCIPYCMTRSLFPPHTAHDMADTAAPHSRGALEPTFACVVQPSPSCNPYLPEPRPREAESTCRGDPQPRRRSSSSACAGSLRWLHRWQTPRATRAQAVSPRTDHPTDWARSWSHPSPASWAARRFSSLVSLAARRPLRPPLCAQRAGGRAPGPWLVR